MPPNLGGIFFMCKFGYKAVTMKNIFAVLLIIGFVSSSCNNNRCENVQCGPNETCLDGGCICYDGYEGPNCDILSSPKYIGTYLASETCINGGGGSTYFPNIQQPSSRPSELVINNFLNQFSVTAFIRGDVGKTGNNIEIPEQQLGGSGTIYGLGAYDPLTRRITINFEYSLNLQNFACTHIFYPQ
jgi:hypothetical protein